MPGLVAILFKFPDWKERLLASEGEIELFVAAQMQTNRGMLFDNEGAYNGHEPWAKLSMRDGQILSKRGDLRKSLAPRRPNGTPGPGGIVRISGDNITIGSNLYYARMMNDGTTKLPGGVLKAKNAKALKIPLPSGVMKSQTMKQDRIFDELMAESSAKRIASLSRRLEKARDLLAEAKGSGSKSKRMKYLKKLENAMRASKSKDEIRRLSRKKNRAEASRGNFIFRKSVTIPARRFDTWTKEDQDELEVALTNKIGEILNRG